MTSDLAALARRFSFGEREFISSLLYRRLSIAVAEDAGLLEIAAHCRAGQQPPNLFFAAVHFLLLGGVQHPLAAYYPSVVAEPRQSLDGVEDAFRSFCLEHRDTLLGLVSTRLVQTNVVKRAAALRLDLAAVAVRHEGPVTLLEIGCSAGLLLCFDRYEYHIGGRTWGATGAAVRLECEWRGERPPPNLDRLPPIAARIGVDLYPIDATNAEDRRWLRALVWPENAGEAELLERALETLAAAPPHLVAGDALEVLPRLATELPAGRALVVFHAATRAHVPQDRRKEFDETIAALGRNRPLYWLSLEAGALRPDPRVPAQIPGHVLGLRQIEGELRTEEHLALVDAHADWIQPLDV